MKCKNCFKDTMNPHFCSKSCSVTFNNKNRKMNTESKLEISKKLSKPYDYELLVDLYNNGYAITEISKRMNIGRTTIYKIIKNNHLCRRIKLSNNIKYKKQKISELTIEQLNLIVSASNSYQEVLLKMGYSKQAGSTHKKIKHLILQNNIDISHFDSTKEKFKRYKIEDILVVNSSYTNSNSLKKRLVKEGLLSHECSGCGLSNIWNNKPLTLQLDHINGINNDNRLENLRLLCPNCHSQTPTYSGKNKRV